MQYCVRVSYGGDLAHHLLEGGHLALDHLGHDLAHVLGQGVVVDAGRVEVDGVADVFVVGLALQLLGEDGPEVALLLVAVHVDVALVVEDADRGP